MAALLKDAIKPNLVQTLEGTPAFIHGGPLPTSPTAATPSWPPGWPSSWATMPITEAGFGADLGAEKFLDIKCRLAGSTPMRVVVATVRALKHHGGCPKAELGSENLGALEKGLPNLLQHVANITEVYGLPCVVAVNRSPPTPRRSWAGGEPVPCTGVNVAPLEVWAKGGEGGVALAGGGHPPLRCAQPLPFSYELDASIEDKLAAIVTKVYHGDGGCSTPPPKSRRRELTELGFGSCPSAWPRPSTPFSR